MADGTTNKKRRILEDVMDSCYLSSLLSAFWNIVFKAEHSHELCLTPSPALFYSFPLVNNLRSVKTVRENGSSDTRTAAFGGNTNSPYPPPNHKSACVQMSMSKWCDISHIRCLCVECFLALIWLVLLQTTHANAKILITEWIKLQQGGDVLLLSVWMETHSCFVY